VERAVVGPVHDDVGTRDDLAVARNEEEPQRIRWVEGRHEVAEGRERRLEIVADDVPRAVHGVPGFASVVEVVLDLGRRPEARTEDGFTDLLDRVVTADDLAYVIARIGSFGPDNRAGIPKTLHRISAIRNRQGNVVGVTCRVGRAVFGTIDIIRDVVESGRSLLLLGRPGVGKTTMLREIARVLADEAGRRVVIVDTSNEIAGDGDVPHPAIGRARRMQVPLGRTQAQVMIEAVENHMPEVVVIDEIGTEEEARAARTIAERGVQLIATAHGNTLANLIANPTLSDLVGGIQAVTLGDEEARKRGTQKTVLERKASPTFDILVELHGRDEIAIHHDVAKTVDLMLRGISPRPEIRVRDRESGTVTVVQRSNLDAVYDGSMAAEGAAYYGEPANGEPGPLEADAGPGPLPWRTPTKDKPLRVYPHGISRNRLQRLIDAWNAPVEVTENLKEAHLVLTNKGQYRKMPKRLKEAERRGLPVHILRSNTIGQMERFLMSVTGEDDPDAL